MNDLATQFGARIRDARRCRGLTQSDLARQVGVGQALISHLEKGARAGSIATLVRIADVLGVSLDSLAGRGTHNTRAHSQVARLVDAANRCPRKELATLIRMAEQAAQGKDQRSRTSARSGSPRR